MPDAKHDLLVIGAGPGGYVAAIRAAQLGLDTACVEKVKELGGVCLRVGCIPSKALLESSEQYEQAKSGLGVHGVNLSGVALDLQKMLARKDRVVKTLTSGVASLFRKNKITRYEGHARLQAPGRVVIDAAGRSTAVEAERIVIATGSETASLPGVELDGGRIGTSTEALAYPAVPDRLIVIGAGYIGLEMGSVWRRLGARVTVVEYLDRILPGMDAEIAAEAHKLFARQGLRFRLGARVTGARVEGSRCIVAIDGAEPLTGDRVLVAVGRRPNTAGLGLEALGIAADSKGRIPVNDRYETSAPGVFAIGDVIAGPMLAHKAAEEGIACVERIVTGYGHVNYDAIPGVCYTHPEVAAVGKTEEQLTAVGAAFRKGKFPFRASGRARALGAVDGFVKMLADAETDRLLGVHIVGPRAGDLIAEAAAAIEFGASAEDVARASHAHPTLAETLKEAALDLDGRAIHF